MICPLCGGRVGGYASNAVPSRSKAISQLISDLGPTCFCRSTVDQVESLVLVSEEALDDLTQQHFPGARSREEVRLKLMKLPKNDTLRLIFFKRMEYESLLRERLLEKLKAQPRQGIPKEVSHSIGKRIRKKTALPKRTGGSISDWLDDLDS